MILVPLTRLAMPTDSSVPCALDSMGSSSGVGAGEAVGDYVERACEARVGEAGADRWHPLDVVALERYRCRGLDVLSQLSLEVGRVGHGHVVDLVADPGDILFDAVELCAEVVVVLVRESADVAREIYLLRDAVRFDAAVNHRGRDGHTGQRGEHRGEARIVLGDLGDDLVDVLSRRRVLDGEAGQMREQAGRGVALRLVGLNTVEKLRQPVQCVGALPGNGRMGADALDFELDLEPTLLPPHRAGT